MNDDDDVESYFETEIPLTPESDAQYVDVGKGILIFIAIVGAIVLLTILLH